MNYTDCDLEAIKILDDFLPEKIFDAHIHISLYPFAGADKFGITNYKRDTAEIFKKRGLRCTAFAAPTEELKNKDYTLKTVSFIENQLDAFPDCVGCAMVKPEDSYEEIAFYARHKGIKGLKCYHKYAKRQDTENADIHEYLSDAALSFANNREMAVIIHLVKNQALSDKENMRQIKEIAKKYPNVKLVLAHCARAFAPWTVIEAVSELTPYENVFFDFSAVCESPPMIALLKKIGTSRCMWGSDYNVSMLLGKAISLGDSFYWINERDISAFPTVAKIRARHVMTENLMALREAVNILGLSKSDIYDLFYGNACRIFGV